VKILWIDTETSGLDPNIHGIISLAAMVEIDGEIRERQTLYMDPRGIGKQLDAKALEVNGFTPESIGNLPAPKVLKSSLDELMGKYVDKFDKNDKFIAAGYNVRFDVDMLNSLFKAFGDNYLFSWISGAMLDVMAAFQFCVWMWKIQATPRNRLTDVAAALGINTEGAHGAMADIEMTRAVAMALRERFESPF